MLLTFNEYQSTKLNKLPKPELLQARTIRAGFRIISNCKRHTSKSKYNSNCFVELLTQSTIYPCISLKPDGHVLTHETVQGCYPKNSALFQNSITLEFYNVNEMFNEAFPGARIPFVCGCIIVKLSEDEIKSQCEREWYPFVFGEPNRL